MQRFESPNGTYAVRVDAWEARMSLWVETPKNIDCHSRTVLFAFSDERWSLERATWLNASVVHLLLRRFPGDHLPTFVEVVVDCGMLRLAPQHPVALKS